MARRGIGVKSTGKDQMGAKRHRKVSVTRSGITKPAILRLSRRGGVKRISGPIYAEVCTVFKDSWPRSPRTPPPMRAQEEKNHHRHAQPNAAHSKKHLARRKKNKEAQNIICDKFLIVDFIFFWLWVSWV